MRFGSDLRKYQVGFHVVFPNNFNLKTFKAVAGAHPFYQYAGQTYSPLPTYKGKTNILLLLFGLAENELEMLGVGSQNSPTSKDFHIHNKNKEDYC